jgi:hypothetical protein
MTRRTIKEQYGFQAETMNNMQRRNDTGTVDPNVQEARRLVMQIRASLEAFRYDPAPANDAQVRVRKPMQQLENGAEYEGQWDLQGRKNG